MSRRPLAAGVLAVRTLAICSTLAANCALAADFPAGTYEAKGAPYTVSFNANGRFEVHQGEKLQVAGTYSVKAGEVELTDADGPWACTKAGEQAGTYSWEYQKLVLTFSKIADKCADRVGSLVGLAWTRRK
jgi:hypothetical protein